MKCVLSRKRVAVIFGGVGKEHSISVKSAENFIGLIKKSDYIPIPIYISRCGKWTLYSPDKNPKMIEGGLAGGIKTYPVRLGKKRGFAFLGGVLTVCAAIPLLHGDGGEDGSVQGALECAGIPYVGADVGASAICNNKAYTKTFAEALGIPTLPWLYTECSAGESDICEIICRAEEKLGYPMFIKPPTLGSSFGCSAVYSRADFAPAYRAAYKLGGGVLIERMLSSKKELEVAYIKTKCNEIFTNPGEISCDSGFYSYEEKYSNDSSAAVSPHSELDSSTLALLREYSSSLVAALGIRHLCRIDFFLSDGKIYFNEINTMPGLTDKSLYTTLINLSGLSPENMAKELVEAAIAGI